MPNNQLKAFKVLIVDDEKTIQTLVLSVLQNMGFKDITSANSGRQAIELVKAHKFDFIITDWRMGDLDGPDLIRFVRTAPECIQPAIPIIMLTGNTEAHYVKAALTFGINGYLLKPFAADQLARRIRAVIENPLQFVIAPTYRGPNRRRTNKGLPTGSDRRKLGK
jgi:two-component system chemotaxis response regulator CheY